MHNLNYFDKGAHENIFVQPIHPPRSSNSNRPGKSHKRPRRALDEPGSYSVQPNITQPLYSHGKQPADNFRVLAKTEP